MTFINETMSILWKHSADKFALKELDKMSGATSNAVAMACSLATHCGSVGDEIAENDESTWRKDPVAVASLLFSVQEQIQTIQSLIELGVAARDRADRKRGWSKDA